MFGVAATGAKPGLIPSAARCVTLSNPLLREHAVVPTYSAPELARRGVILSNCRLQRPASVACGFWRHSDGFRLPVYVRLIDSTKGSPVPSYALPDGLIRAKPDLQMQKSPLLFRGAGFSDSYSDYRIEADFRPKCRGCSRTILSGFFPTLLK